MEQQKIRKLSKKEYTPPTDPLWHDQWSLVSHGNCWMLWLLVIDLSEPHMNGFAVNFLMIQ